MGTWKSGKTIGIFLRSDKSCIAEDQRAANRLQRICIAPAAMKPIENRIGAVDRCERSRIFSFGDVRISWTDEMFEIVRCWSPCATFRYDSVNTRTTRHKSMKFIEYLWFLEIVRSHSSLVYRQTGWKIFNISSSLSIFSTFVWMRNPSARNLNDDVEERRIGPSKCDEPDRKFRHSSYWPPDQVWSRRGRRPTYKVLKSIDLSTQSFRLIKRRITWI